MQWNEFRFPILIEIAISGFYGLIGVVITA